MSTIASDLHFPVKFILYHRLCRHRARDRFSAEQKSRPLNMIAAISVLRKNLGICNDELHESAIKR